MAIGVAQTTFKSEKDLKKNAEQLFKRENYVAALPLFSQLLSLYPQDPHYNYKFGVCMLMADKRDVEKPLRHLEIAAKSDAVDKEVYYFLGLAYHYNYRFSEAIKSYNNFLQQAPRRLHAKYDANRQIEMCYNGIALLRSISDLYVLERHHVGLRNFHRSYNLKDFGGRFLALPEELKTRLDKRNNHNPIVFFSDEQEYLYYSSFGQRGETAKDIYRVYRNPDGTWDEPERLPDIINTPYDEDHPFIMPDGLTLFFSSKGHNSMGGYDVFMTTFDTVTDSWSKPENLDFAINTPYDDVLFITDRDMQNAYFASNRVSDVGMINVYKVRIDTRLDTDDAILANAFNLSQDDPAYKRALQLLHDRTKLEVNATESMFDKPEIVQVTERQKVKDDVAFKTEETLTNADIVRMALEASDEVRQEINELKMKQNAAKMVVEQRKQRALVRLHEAQKARNDAIRMTNPSHREDALIESAGMQAEADRLAKEAEIAEDIYKDIIQKVKLKENELISAERYADNIQKAIQAESPERAIAILENMLKEIPSDVSASYTEKSIEEIIAEADSRLPETKNEIKELKHDIESLRADAERLKSEADRTRNNALKEDLMQQVALKESEAGELQLELNQMLSAIDDTYLETQAIATTEAKDKKTVLTEKANTYKDLHNASIETLKAQQNHLLLQAQEKINESQKLSAQANSLLADSENTGDPSKRIEKQEAAQKTLEAATSRAYEASAFQSAAQQTNTIIENSEKLKTKFDNTFVKLQEHIAKNDFERAEKILEELSKTHPIANVNALADENFRNNLSQKAAKNQSEAEKLYAEADNLYEKHAQNTAEINRLREQTRTMQEGRDKNRLEKQMANLEKENLSLLADAEKSYNKASDMRFDAGKLRMELSILTSEIPESTEAPSTTLAFENIKKEVQNIQTQLAATQVQLKLAAEITGEDLSLADSEIKLADIQTTDNETEVYSETINRQAFINESHEIKSNYDEKIAVFEARADRLYSYAAEKSKTAKLGITQADDIIRNARTINEVQRRNQEIDKANRLYEQSFNQAQEVLAAANLAQELEAQIETLKRNRQFLVSALNEAENMLDAGNGQRAEAALQSLKRDYQPDRIEQNIQKRLTDAGTQAISRKQREAEELLRLSENQYADAQNLKKQSDLLVRQAQSTENPTERQNLINEAIRLDKQAEERKLTADDNYNKGHQLQIEVGVLRMKVDFTVNIEQIPDKHASFSTDNIVEVIADVGNLQKRVGEHHFAIINEDIIKTDDALSQVIAAQTDAQTTPLAATDSPRASNLIRLEQQYADYSAQAAEQKRQAANTTNTAARTEHLRTANALEQKARDVQLQVFEIQAKENKDRFETQETQIKRLKTDSDDENAVRARLLTSESDIYFQRAEQRRKEAADTDIMALRANLLEDANRNEKLALQRQKEAISLFEKAQERTLAQTTPSPSITQQVTPVQPIVQERQETPANQVQPRQQPTTTQTERVQVTQPPVTPASRQQTDTRDDMLSQIEGLFFTVQIGVFGGSRTSEQLLNLSPLYYDRLPNGWYRYFYGIYNGRNAAVAARNVVVARGIDDAFVVAYFNGRRIGVAEAVAMLETGQAALQSTLAFSGTETQTPQQTTITQTDLTGLYYTVQVGVYREQRPSSALYNMSPLFYESLPNGLQRHMYGRYNNKQIAETAKNDAVRRGVTDAFVVAYHNGRRVSLAEARQLEESGVAFTDVSVPAAVRTTTPAQVTTPATQQTDAPPAAVQTEQIRPAIQEPAVYNREAVSFKVQIGAFRQAVAPHILNQYRAMAGHEVEVLRTNTGLTVYLVGNYKDFADAGAMRSRIVNAGIPDAFVVAYHNNERIPLNAARDILR